MSNAKVTLISITIGIITFLIILFGFYLSGADLTRRGPQLVCMYFSDLIISFIVSISYATNFWNESE